MHIYLIAVPHRRYLYKGMLSWRNFFEFLKKTAKENGVDLIAETLNQEEISQYKLASDSVARLAARDINIRHLFCDPDMEERRLLGIKTKNELAQELGYSNPWPLEQNKELEKIVRGFWPLREKFWLARILEKKFKRAIFIFGDYHIESFSKLLGENEISCEVIKVIKSPNSYGRSGQGKMSRYGKQRG